MEEEEEMPETLSARLEFRHLSESEVWDAIDGDPEGENPITAEVTRLVARYLLRFKASVDRNGNVPAHIMHVRVQWPIERVAVLLMVSAAEARTDQTVH